MITQVIKQSLSSAPPDPWSHINLAIHNTADLALQHAQKTQFSMRDLKDLNYKKRVGELWEHFCCLWLQHHTNLSLTRNLAPGYPLIRECWLWPDIPPAIKSYLRLGSSHQDNGIDAILRLSYLRADGTWWSWWYPVQCKYRWTKSKGFNVTVTWNNLATFLALVNATGPPEGWSGHLVMTNCKGVSWKSPKGPKDIVYATGTFKKTTLETWRLMCGQSIAGQLLGHEDSGSVDDEVQYSNNNDNKEPSTLIILPTQGKELSPQELIRAKRLAYFATQDKSFD